MDDAVRQALARDTLIDITTTGRRTGMPRRTEIWFHYQDGRILITGSPGPRGWYANMTANPRFTWHFKQSLTRDIPAVATPITDENERRALFARMMELEERMAHVELDDWARRSPMVEVELAP
jgi:deazaflavin-dependent oxidoreductase (nitroreductase family)